MSAILGSLDIDMFNNPRILVGVISGEFIRVKTVQTLLALMKNERRITKLLIKQGVLVHVNRDNIVLDALKEDFTHLFFVDSDVCFAPDTLDKLLAHDKDIIAANYNMRIVPQTPTVRMMENGKLVVKDLPKGLFKCYAAGTGCMLIKMEVFKKLSRPWFHFGAMDENNEGEGEDVFFCRRAQEVGYEVWCDGSLQVGHIGETIF